MIQLIPNKKCETQSNVIMWLGIIIAVVIAVIWSIKHIEPRHLDLETVDADLEDIQGHISSACSSVYYKAKFNPRTINGKLIINDTEICIENSFDKCRMLICPVNMTQVIPLHNVTYLIIEKNQTYNFYSE